MSEKTRHLYAFGPFHLDAKERLLILDGKPVPLAHKAFEALLMLVENAGRLVDKDDLMRRLWPDTFVEEANVAKHVSLLRKVLSEATNGREYIETIPKRGYRFVVDVTEVVSTALESKRWPFSLNNRPSSPSCPSSESSRLCARCASRPMRDLRRKLPGNFASGRRALPSSTARLRTWDVLGIKVLNCRTGETLAQEQLTANGKERVLKAIGEAAAQVRGKLGESLSTVQKFDTPVEQATTPSLEALQAYSMGRKTMTQKSDFSAAVAFFQRATSLDSNFAMAYSSLGNAYWSLGEKNLGAENARKAYELRERVSDREKFYIECNYQWAAGDLEKARQAYELWAQTYPRDDVPRGYLGKL